MIKVLAACKGGGDTISGAFVGRTMRTRWEVGPVAVPLGKRAYTRQEYGFVYECKTLRYSLLEVHYHFYLSRAVSEKKLFFSSHEDYDERAKIHC